MAEMIPFHRSDEFGFTNKPEALEAVRQWRDAALADGWTERDMDNDPRRRRSELKRDGFVVHAVTRDNSEKAGRYAFEADLHIWGPDGLAVKVPPLYDFDAIEAGCRTCSKCRRKDVETERVGFAGRVCVECLPAERAKIETLGWCS